MKVPQEKKAVEQVVALLVDLVGAKPSETSVRRQRDAGGADAIAEIGRFRFVIEWKGSGAIASVVGAVEQVLRSSKELGGGVIPLVAVPYMGREGQVRCEKAGVAWVDLSGNARISEPPLRIHIEGRPNGFKRRGRPSSAFAPKSSRIARWLLIHPAREMSQREIAIATEMDEGFTSRIVATLVDENLVLRTPGGKIRARDPNLLLDAWAEEYRFERHRVVQGHIPARSSDALLDRLSSELRVHKIGYAATGLSAAWIMTRFTGYRIVTLYVDDEERLAEVEQLGFREDERGANTWLVVPNDRGVFQGALVRDGVRCVHPVQVYLDLAGHPERSSEAAQRVRSEHLRWKVDD
jgi:hypothetical protein